MREHIALFFYAIVFSTLYNNKGVVCEFLVYGLPNITGGLTFYEMIGGVPSSGVFSTSNEYAPRPYRNGGGGYHSSVSFDASRSNNIYGSSNTVQPASIIMLPCIRY